MSEGYYWTMLALGAFLIAIFTFAMDWPLGGLIVSLIALTFLIAGQVADR